MAVASIGLCYLVHDLRLRREFGVQPGKQYQKNVLRYCKSAKESGEFYDFLGLLATHVRVTTRYRVLETLRFGIEC